MHLLDRFLALLLGEPGEAPIVEHAVVQPVLVDGAELVLEGLVEDIDDVFLALHAALRCVADDWAGLPAIGENRLPTQKRVRAIPVPTTPTQATPAGAVDGGEAR